MAMDMGPACMTMIGLGYLFPIAAIWAAFDYWKELFPTTNVEFTVTCVYQVGSVVTVMALSNTKGPVSLKPRIQMGMAGQFVCLIVIMCFRWMGLTVDVLYWSLLATALTVSIATGFLDSAIFSLCSQYGPTMQGWLQLGIGLGTLVSVVYRDATKLLLPGDVVDGTTAYFAVAIFTIAVCYGCYKYLMALPISRHVVIADEKAARGIVNDGLKEALIQVDSPVSPRISRKDSPNGYVSPNDSPDITRQNSNQSGKENMDVEAAKACAVDCRKLNDADCRDTEFGPVWQKVWKNQTTIFLNLVLTTFCYPGVITAIPCRDLLTLRPEMWFQTLLLTAFTFADMGGRFLTGHRFGLSAENVWITVIVRALVFPMVIVCATSNWTSDSVAFVVVSMFGFLNGYCVSMSLIVVNEVPGLSDEQRKTCGRISAVAVNTGLCVGSCCASLLAALVHL